MKAKKKYFTKIIPFIQLCETTTDLKETVSKAPATKKKATNKMRKFFFARSVRTEGKRNKKHNIHLSLCV